MPDSISNISVTPESASTSVIVEQTHSVTSSQSVSQRQNSVPSVQKVSAKIDSVIVLSPTVSDSAVDTVIAEEKHFGVALVEEPQGHNAPPRAESASESSWLMLLIVAVFLMVSLRYKNNFKYLKAIVSDLTDIRPRHNVFDDTVRESSFLISLNVMCAISAGLLLHVFLCVTSPVAAALPFYSSVAVVVGTVSVYYLWQLLTYWVMGNIFSDSAKTSNWIKGFASSQGILGVILFPLALMSMFYPHAAPTLTTIAFVCFILARIIFIFKGFRIFFVQISSWLLFLYYLCSVEIIPVIFTYFAALKICEVMS